jgi:hypothetical protein
MPSPSDSNIPHKKATTYSPVVSVYPGVATYPINHQWRNKIGAVRKVPIAAVTLRDIYFLDKLSATIAPATFNNEQAKVNIA